MGMVISGAMRRDMEGMACRRGDLSTDTVIGSGLSRRDSWFRNATLKKLTELSRIYWFFLMRSR